jgi:diaminopimelate decarboxylase
MNPNLSVTSIEKAFKSALQQGLIREEDTAVIFHDLTFLEERIKRLKSVFPSSALHGAAIKANPLISVLKLVREQEIGVEAATTGEIRIALQAGFEPRRIVFDSPVKTRQDLEFALKTGVHINIDNLSELERAADLLLRIHSTSTFGIRINPQVGVGTIAESSVAGEYSKFGVPIKYQGKELTAAFLKYPWLTGVHLHVGSQGCPVELLLNGIGVLYDFVNRLNPQRESAGLPPIFIFDIGGGLPISYKRDSAAVTIGEYAAEIRNRFPELFTSQFSLITEFGRWMFVNSGWVVSRVEYVKRDPLVNTAMLHVGADLLLRECLNPKDWQHEYSVLDHKGNLKQGADINPCNLAGPLCFSGDIIAKNVTLPTVEEGDYLIIHDAGGYTFSMWSRYNSRQTPRILGYFYDGEEFRILKERESHEDILRFWG